MTTKTYEYLPQEAKDIRINVFVDEQGFENELDDIDDIATHIVLFDENTPIGTCRLFSEDDGYSYHIGRVAVNSNYRGKHCGAILIKAAEECIIEKGGKEILIGSQQRVKDFYMKQGYISTGEEYLDEGCPHIMLKKTV